MISTLIDLLQVGIPIGLLLSLVALGVYIHAKVLKIEDFTVEGSFSLGGAITAWLLVHNIYGLLAIPIAFLFGSFAGLISGILQTKCKMSSLISGIVVTMGLFSINLNIAGANVSVLQAKRIFNNTDSFRQLMVIAPIAIGAIYLIHFLLDREFGFLLQAVGTNRSILKRIGKSPDLYLILGLMIGNGLCAVAGCLLVQYLGFFSIWGNVGVLIAALASLILSELISSTTAFSLSIGSILYQLLIAVTMELHIDPSWIKLITAIFVVLLLQIKKEREICLR